MKVSKLEAKPNILRALNAATFRAEDIFQTVEPESFEYWKFLYEK
jgi:hypothetical protein